MSDELILPNSQSFWLLSGATPIGPFSLEQVHAKLATGQISWETPACRNGEETWQSLRETSGVGPNTPLPTPSPPSVEEQDAVANREPSSLTKAITTVHGSFPITILGLLAWCDQFPNEAAKRLLNQEFEQFFSEVGRPDWAKHAALARASSTVPSDCLETFLRLVDDRPRTSMMLSKQPVTDAILIATPVPAVDSGRASTQSRFKKLPVSGWVAIVAFAIALILGIGYEVTKERPQEHAVKESKQLNAREVTLALFNATTRNEAEKYCTLNLDTFLDEVFREQIPDDPNDKFEVLDEQDAPNGIGGKYVWFRGQFFDHESRRRVQMAGFCHVILADTWRVDDILISTFDGQAFEQPISFVWITKQMQNERGNQISKQPVKQPSPTSTALRKASFNNSFRVPNLLPRPKAWYENRIVHILIVGTIIAIIGAITQRGRR